MNDPLHIHTNEGFMWESTDFRPLAVRPQEVEPMANSRRNLHLKNELNSWEENLLIVPAFMAPLAAL